MVQSGHQLNEREELILQAVVHTYITTAEAVGSRSIVRRFGLELSPATVRNVMSDLEEAGYLEQLHTSSGRVPTDRGYRYYVNYLMRVQELTLSERTRIEREITARLDDLDDVMRRTSHLLALVSHNTGIVEGLDKNAAEVRQIELMSVGSSRLAIMLVDNYGAVRTSLVTLEDSLSAEELQKLRRFLDERLCGLALDRLEGDIRESMRDFVDEQRLLAERALKVLGLVPPQGGQLYLEGATQLFEQPEFRDAMRAREVFGLLEERDRLANLLRAAVQDEPDIPAHVIIGSESKRKGLEDISVVASPYCVGDKPAGLLGVLGPRRMPYSRLAGLVQYTADMLSRFLTSVAGQR